MKKEIAAKQLELVNDYKNQMLLNNEGIFVIKDYTVVNEKHVQKKTIFNRHPITVDRMYITDVTVLHYKLTDAIIIISDDKAFKFINDFCIPVYRLNWTIFREQLKLLGINLIPFDRTGQESQSNPLI